MISEQEVIDFVAQHRADFEAIEPSFFEMTVALAFDAFTRHQVDIAIIEVGLGGRLDSTNIITPLLSVITNIGWDHMNMLGDTLPLIAGEKAGIIKPGIPVIIGEHQPEVAEVFIKTATEKESPIIFASEQWDIIPPTQQSVANAGQQSLLDVMAKSQPENPVQTSYQLQLDLTGTYQLKNIKTVLSAVEALRNQGWVIADEHIITALKQVKTLTGLQGRWQTLSFNPLTICDTGHNPDGIQEVLKNIAGTPYQHLHFVLGMVNDKDTSKVLSLLPKTDTTYYFSKPDLPRGLDAELLQQQAQAFGLHGEVYASVPLALKAAQQQAGLNDLVFAGGSTFVVAEIV
jgi:dihydrofolate synthase/folylpolyglutamate synthase